MLRLRLIESFTCMMLNIEWYLLQEFDEYESDKILNFNHFKEIEAYLKLISKKSNGSKFDRLDYLEVLDFLINLEQSKQLELNEITLNNYSETDLIRLISDTTKLLAYIDISK